MLRIIALAAAAAALPWTPALAGGGASLPPLAEWQATVVRADGASQSAAVDGANARIVHADGWTTIIRGDQAFHYDQTPDAGVPPRGTITWWGMFPPLVLEPIVQLEAIEPQPLGRETLFGEQVTRVRLDWEDEMTSVHGEAWLTDDGIFLQVDVGGIITECCLTERRVPWSLQYHLEDLVRAPADPAAMEPPQALEWAYMG